MSEVEQEQRSVAASLAEARSSLWRRWFSSTGAPPAWALVHYMVCGLLLAAALAGALPHVRGTLLPALAGAIVATHLLWARDHPAEAESTIPVAT